MIRETHYRESVHAPPQPRKRRLRDVLDWKYRQTLEWLRDRLPTFGPVSQRDVIAIVTAAHCVSAVLATFGYIDSLSTSPGFLSKFWKVGLLVYLFTTQVLVAYFIRTFRNQNNR